MEEDLEGENSFWELWITMEKEASFSEAWKEK